MLRALIIIGILCTLIFSVQYFWNLNQRGLESYVRNHIQKDLQVQVKCTMNSQDRSRKGRCVFILTSKQFQTLKSDLQLVLIETKFHQQMDGCLSTDSTLGFRQLTESQVYRSLNPPPPMEGNSRTSFLQLRYDQSTLHAYVDLEYPYS